MSECDYCGDEVEVPNDSYDFRGNAGWAWVEHYRGHLDEVLEGSAVIAGSVFTFLPHDWQGSKVQQLKEERK